ncbi:putative ATP-dependent zinc protease [Lyngbya aestuarii]|uniref:putative ATP-dependent zinc protease n=1 Tax=Lyngbya aestuarii TaxID=118322 RepID=UPI00403D7C59
MKFSSQEQLPIIGWREWLSLPDIGITQVKAKIDTGARSSTLHAFDVETFQQNGKMMVRFKVHPYQRDTHRTVFAEAELLDKREVRSSIGHTQLRPVIQTTVDLAGRLWPIELTLTNRDVMGFRMLLGRQAVRRRFLVDAAGSFLQSSTRSSKRQQDKEQQL